MNIARKVEMARQAIRSITRHDDADDAELQRASLELQQFLRDEMKAAAIRRQERATPPKE